MYKKVQGEPNLIRDSRTGAIINRNAKAYQAALSRKKTGDRVKKLEEKMVRMEDSLQQLHVGLQTIINKLDK
tara:strand:+ start:674 stop:889 length:216 start_codon:yes stop_codon:yes gene_type:complete